jgi:formylmethanofuran dehydrogenase subunit C
LIPREVESRSTAVARYEGGRVEVDGDRKRTAAMCSEGGEVEVDGNRKRTVTVHTEVGVEAVACLARDEVVMFSGVVIEDKRRLLKVHREPHVGFGGLMTNN